MASHGHASPSRWQPCGCRGRLGRTPLRGQDDAILRFTLEHEYSLRLLPLFGSPPLSLAAACALSPSCCCSPSLLLLLPLLLSLPVLPHPPTLFLLLSSYLQPFFPFWLVPLFVSPDPSPASAVSVAFVAALAKRPHFQCLQLQQVI